jgi:Calpain family cysteine protease
MSFDYTSNGLETAKGLNINPNTQPYKSSLEISNYNYSDTLISRSSFNEIPNSLATSKNTLVNSNAFVSNNNSGTLTQTVKYSANQLIDPKTIEELLRIIPGDNNDWFSNNLLDEGLITKTRELTADGELSRKDMIDIFRDAKDGNMIDANELKDLRVIVSSYSRFNMQDHVRVLSNKLVNGDVANANYQGESLGNLYANTSSEHMEKLINKWFFGGDRPKTTQDDYTYKREASGSLFQNGVSYQDIKQGAVGDCYLLAGLGAVAYHSPSKIENMFIDNNDNTYTVRFYNNGVADYVTVDKYLPTDSSGRFVYANLGNSDNNNNNELWVALAEKAYAQINESGWLGRDNITNSYNSIAGGLDAVVVNQVTGMKTGYSQLDDFNSMVNTFNKGNLIGIGSKSNGIADNIVANHAYTVVGYNSSTQKFTLFNPWGTDGASDADGKFKPGILELSFAELKNSFSLYTFTIS